MKRFLIALALIILALVVTFPVSASTHPNYPESINGLPVIYIKTCDNTFGLESGQVILTLLDKNSLSDRESAKKLNFSKYLAENPLPKGWSIEVYGGLGATEESFKFQHEKNFEFLKENGPIFLGSTNLLTEKTTMRSDTYTFATVKDTDPSYTTIDYIGVRFYAPEVGANQDHWSYLGVNGLTNTSYFLQSGMVFYDGSGYLVWSDTTEGYEAQYFDISYVEGNECSFSVFRSGSYWCVSCFDYDASEYDYYVETSSSGSYLVTSGNTSVWFENWNTGANWYQGFSNPVEAFYAQDGYGYVWYNSWQHQSISILDAYNQEQPNNSIITGALTSYQSCYFHLDNILLAQ